MHQKSFSLAVGVLFLIIAALHGIRLIYGWNAVIGGLEIPFWASWVALIVAGHLSYTGFKFGINAK